MPQIHEARWRRLSRTIGEMTGESAFRKRVGNIGHLMAGNFGAGVVSFFAVALAARGLGVEQFGVLALVSTFIQAIERFVSFQTWQPIIKYGAPLKDAGRLDDLKSLIKFGVLLDLGAAVVGFLIAVLLALAGADRFDWSAETVNSILVYSAALLLLITGSPTGIMRLGGRFREIAYFQVVAMGVRCVLCIIALAAGAGLFTYVAIWAATHVLGALLLAFASAFELKRLGCADFPKASLKDLSNRFPKIWRFSILANLSLTVRSSAQQLDTLIVGALAGAGGAGLYHIAKRIAKFAQQAGQQVQAVVFPDIAKLWGRSDLVAFRKDVSRTEGLLIGVCAVGVLATFLLAEPVVAVFAGGKYADAGGMLKVQIIAVAALIAGSVTRAALLCMGRESTVFVLTVCSTAIFFASAFVLIPKVGAIGANYAHAAAGVFIVAAFWIAYRMAIRSGAPNAPRTDVTTEKFDDGF
jgi:O-antigen/teichoic acid export membrane protein